MHYNVLPCGARQKSDKVLLSEIVKVPLFLQGTVTDELWKNQFPQICPISCSFTSLADGQPPGQTTVVLSCKPETLGVDLWPSLQRKFWTRTWEKGQKAPLSHTKMKLNLNISILWKLEYVFFSHLSQGNLPYLQNIHSNTALTWDHQFSKLKNNIFFFVSSLSNIFSTSSSI